MTALLFILLLSCGAAALASLLLLRVMSARPGESSRKSRRPARSGASAKRAPEKADRARLEQTADSAKRLTGAERQEMLEGVKNLAEENPERVADLIRTWIHEDPQDPRGRRSP
jgi:flagellar biosynthesis/type III secretory pathway M-ring protein FliF/YscJ